MVGGGWVGVRVGRSGGLQQGLLASVEKKLLKVPQRLFKEALAAAGVRAGVRETLCRW